MRHLLPYMKSMFNMQYVFECRGVSKNNPMCAQNWSYRLSILHDRRKKGFWNNHLFDNHPSF